MRGREKTTALAGRMLTGGRQDHRQPSSRALGSAQRGKRGEAQRGFRGFRGFRGGVGHQSEALLGPWKSRFGLFGGLGVGHPSAARYPPGMFGSLLRPYCAFSLFPDQRV